MSIKSCDAALDFVPESKPKGRAILATLGMIIQALRDGRAAETDYHRFLRSGLAPDEAARRTFERHHYQH